jgi:hypothetical protein
MIRTAAVRRGAVAMVAAACMVTMGAGTASAQAGGNEGNVTVSAGIDAINAYMFRGIYQDDTRVIMWPYAELGLSIFSGEGGLQSVAASVGTWNSLHTGSAGSRGPTGKLWYESDFYAGLGLGFARGVSVDTTFTAYTSPNDSFDTIKEIAFGVGVDDSPALGRGALQPYGLVAFELGEATADGHHKGIYLELGVSPGVEGSRVSLSVPVKVGLSLRDFYELEVSDGVIEDNRFGFVSVGGIVTVPLTGIPARFGSWDVHGGVELQRLGTTTRALNRNGDASKVIGLFGVSLSY